ncbi:hypothetical protein Y093_22895 [Salmonella enterica subsp. enterica serovar Tennessee]|nr:hypothetical protein Y093_22895 [Salmonella enterica subsp. enterica serovar Tennessee]
MTDAANALHCAFVFNFTTKGIAGIGWINNNTAFTHNVDGLINQPLLWVIRMDIKNWLILPSL